MVSRIVLILSFLVASTTHAEPLAIFSRSDARPVTSARAPAPPDQARFWAAYAADRRANRPYEQQLPLISPPDWGKTLSPQTGGTVSFHRRFPQGFVCRLALHHLDPKHRYILTLNGNPEKAGNPLLPTPVPGNEAEKYYDFLDIATDAAGAYQADLGVWLRSGAYDVRLYVKDATDFKIVLYRDFFPFTVE